MVLASGLLMGLSGCAGIQPQRQQQAATHGSDQRLLSVPFYPDGTDQCGPSVLASVLTYWNHPVDPPTLKKEIYLVQLKGSLPMDLMLDAQNRGFKAHLYNGSIADLKEELSSGHPLIAFINRGYDFYPIGHFVVIIGYDDSRHGLYMHSGLKKDQFVTYRGFLKDWDKTMRTTLLILPPEHDKESTHAGT
jgi:ABC-type bacteriocin/lantibiotic exporter with double-glycine peptidase domain